MIIISSFRNFADDAEWHRNQLLAFRSWMMFARKIFLFGEIEPEVATHKTRFIPSEPWPRIKDMAVLASQQKTHFTAICNGDIVIDPAILKLEMRMRFTNARCASSRRWHFDPALPMERAREMASLGDDRGRDIFIARWDVWRELARDLPEKYRIGNAQWDAAITNWFREHHDAGFVDFTAQRIIFHPHHGARKRPYDEEIAAV